MNTHANGLTETQLIDKFMAAIEPESEGSTEETEAELRSDGAEETDLETEVEESETKEQEPESDEESVYLIGDEEITLKELKELRSGSLRQSDYTRKTQELAEQRKEIEAKAATLDKAIAALDERVSDLDSELKTEFDAVNWEELAEYDPSEYLKKQNALKKKEQKLQKAKDDRLAAMQMKAREEANLLFSKTSAADRAEQEKVISQAVKVAKEMGYSDAEINSLIDHRFYLMALKVAKYDELMAKKPEIEKKVAKTPKVTPATKQVAKKTSAFDEAKAKLRQTGSKLDAEQAFIAYFNR